MKDGFYTIQVSDRRLEDCRFTGSQRSITLERAQAMVGGYIEFVSVPSIPGSQAIVNEEGKLRGLFINPLASALTGHTIVGVMAIFIGKARMR